MILRFLQTLHDSGRAELAPPGRELARCVRQAGAEAGEARQLDRMLAQWHRAAVPDLPGPALAYHPEAALGGALLLFRAACLAAFREIDGADIPDLLHPGLAPAAADPAAHFSADLCLRHWPDLYRMARARSEDDPLVKIMHSLAAAFPLSSLGMQLTVPPDLPLLRHPGLCQWFAERALARADHAALACPDIHRLIRAKLGAYAGALGRGLLGPPSPPEPTLHP